MSTSDLKLDLIKAISATNDVMILNEIKDYLNFIPKETGVYKLSDQQLARVNESIQQYKNGEFLTEEEAEKDIQKWFEEEGK
jgi:predicted transcriptional regulator